MSAPPITVAGSDTLALAEELMNVERIRHLPVTDGDVLVGVLSHRDLLAASISTLSHPSEEDDLEQKRRVDVARVMHGIVETATADMPVEQAAETLLAHRIGCLPVIDERHHVVGIVTRSDLLRLVQGLVAKSEPGSGPARSGRC